MELQYYLNYSIRYIIFKKYIVISQVGQVKLLKEVSSFLMAKN